jgi:hypothetical protein
MVFGRAQFLAITVIGRMAGPEFDKWSKENFRSGFASPKQATGFELVK